MKRTKYHESDGSGAHAKNLFGIYGGRIHGMWLEPAGSSCNQGQSTNQKWRCMRIGTCGVPSDRERTIESREARSYHALF